MPLKAEDAGATPARSLIGEFTSELRKDKRRGPGGSRLRPSTPRATPPSPGPPGRSEGQVALRAGHRCDTDRPVALPSEGVLCAGGDGTVPRQVVVHLAGGWRSRIEH